MLVGVVVTSILPIPISCLLSVISILIFVTIILNRRLREQYGVFASKFAVDTFCSLLAIAVSLIVLTDNERSPIVPLVSTILLLIQNVLVLCEAADWWSATFSPLDFHRTNTCSIRRLLPYMIGCLLVIVVFIALMILELRFGDKMAWTGEETSTTLSLCVVGAAQVLMMAIWFNQRGQEYAHPVTFHVFACLLFSFTPMLILTILSLVSSTTRYVISPDTVLGTRMVVTFFVLLHGLLHTLYFVSRHQDVRDVLFRRINSWFCCCRRW